MVLEYKKKSNSFSFHFIGVGCGDISELSIHFSLFIGVNHR